MDLSKKKSLEHDSVLLGKLARIAQKGKAICARDPQAREATALPQSQPPDANMHSIELVRAACANYASRPALGWRPFRRQGQPLEDYRHMTYGALWTDVVCYATAMAAHANVAHGQVVGVWGASSVEWVVADLACLYLAATAAPLQTNMRPADAAHVIDEAAMQTLFVSVAQLPVLAGIIDKCPSVRYVVIMDEEVMGVSPTDALARQHIAKTRDVISMPALADYANDRPITPMAVPGQQGVPANVLLHLMYTSGSTGSPKGAMFDDRLWRENFRGGFGPVISELPLISYAYLPLNHMAGLITAHMVLMSGGILYMPTSLDMSTFFDDVRALRPTFLVLVPRISSMLYQHYQQACHQTDAQNVQSAMRYSYLGDRLAYIILGTAPTSPEVREFLTTCFDVPTVEGYGQTENVSLTLEDRIVRQFVTDYKLVDVPSLGYTRADKPYPRGELCIKSTRMIRGYFKNPEATAALFDDEGYMLTGDVVEDRGGDHLVWVDRKKNILKLSQGEFVSLSRLENLLTDGCEAVSQVYLYGDSSRSFLVGVVVLDAVWLEAHETLPADKIKGALRAALGALATRVGLLAYEVPRDFIVETEPFSQGNGLLTESNKLARLRLQQFYAAGLQGLYAAIEARQASVMSSPTQLLASPKERRAAVLVAVADVTGLTPNDDLENCSFTQLGGDSVGAVRLCDLLQQRHGLGLTADRVLDPAMTMGLLADQIAAGRDSTAQSFARLHPHSAGPNKTDLMAERVLGKELIAQGRSLAQLNHPVDAKHVLLTGATGFLGRFLLLELLQRAERDDGHVTVVVRGQDDATAKARLVRTACIADDDAFTRRFKKLAQSNRLTVCAGDLSQERFGLDPAVYDRLAQSVDVIIHNGALVNHAYGYNELFGPNVLGTIEVIRLALTRKMKLVSFISSVAAMRGAPGETVLPESYDPRQMWSTYAPATGYAAGYGASKWACEVLLHNVHDACGLPVNIFRPSMILAHSRYMGHINVPDMFTRLMCSLLYTRCAPTSFFAADYAGPKHYDGLPVDFVAGSIAALSLNQHEDVRTYNVVNPHHEDGVSIDKLTDWLEKEAFSFERIADYDSWFATFKSRLEALPEAPRQHTVLPIIAAWAHPAQTPEGPQLGTADFSRHACAALGLSNLPRLDQAFVNRVVAHLLHLGLVSKRSFAAAAPAELSTATVE